MTELTGSLLNSGSPQLYTIAQNPMVGDGGIPTIQPTEDRAIPIRLRIQLEIEHCRSGDIGQTMMSTVVSVRFAYPISTGELVPRKPFSRRSTPSLKLLPLLLIGRSSLPLPPPFLLSPCFPLSPHLSPIQPSSPIQPPSAALVDLVGPFCLQPPQLPRPAPQPGSKSSTSPSERRGVSTVSTISSAPSSSRLKPSFTTLSTPSIPLWPRDQ